MKRKLLRGVGVVSLFLLCYFAGMMLAKTTVNHEKEDVFSEGTIVESQDWGLGFSENGKPPTAAAEPEELKAYQTHFLGDTSQKKIYLTFDAGYENGNTEAILDALKKHQACATFFVVGHYLDSAPELIKRMKAEGHIVGNHTEHHYDMSKISDPESFRREIEGVEAKYQKITGEEMKKFYRPPQGKFCYENLEMAKELGYHTFFWSLAYVDWNTDAQPTKEEAFEKLMSRMHPGAIVLLHSTSSTNAAILDELLTKLENEGYTFGSLEDFC